MNVQRGTIDPAACRPVVKRTEVVPFVPADKIETLAQWISAAERPVILAGGGVIACGAYQELRALADKYHIPVTMSMPGMGAYPSDAPLSLGLCGYAGSQWANMAMYKSDLLIGIGTTFHLRQTGSLPKKTVEKGRIARIDLDINELRHSRVPLDIDIHADAKAALTALERALPSACRRRARPRGWSRSGPGKPNIHLLTGKPGQLPQAARRDHRGRQQRGARQEPGDCHDRRRPAPGLGAAPFRFRFAPARAADVFRGTARWVTIFPPLSVRRSPSRRPRSICFVRRWQPADEYPGTGNHRRAPDRYQDRGAGQSCALHRSAVPAPELEVASFHRREIQSGFRGHRQSLWHCRPYPSPPAKAWRRNCASP